MMRQQTRGRSTVLLSTQLPFIKHDAAGCALHLVFVNGLRKGKWPKVTKLVSTRARSEAKHVLNQGALVIVQARGEEALHLGNSNADGGGPNLRSI